VGVTISAPANVEQGSLLNYSLVVKNNGPEVAKNTKVTVDIPANFTFNTPNSSSACDKSGDKVVCSLGDLSNSSPLAVVFTVGTSASCNSKVTTGAKVTTTSDDQNTANNSATSNETTVTCGQCRDARDNDNDGRTDIDDPACHIENDITKAFDPNGVTEDDRQCSDLKDNDNDNLIDEKDPGCHLDNDINKKYQPFDDNESGTAPFDPGGVRVID
jgi:uncharacterized repeat protein (TIGR01451 family)